MRREWALSLALGFLIGCGEGDADGGRAFIQGQVLDLETGAPLSGVTVRSAPTTESTITGDEGRFLLREGVRFNQIYRVFAERDGFSSDFADFTPRATEPDRSIGLELRRIRVCTPGTNRCVEGGVEEAVQVCADDGTRFEAVPCAETEVCSVDTCVPARTIRVVAVGGLVTSQPVGISCNPNCEARFPAGTSISLVAQPFAGGEFFGWSAPCPDPMAATCALTLDGDVEVTARFDQSAFPLEVDFRGDGEGRVQSTPAGVDCTADCTVPFERDLQVDLEATAEPGSVFVGWGGGCSGQNCSLRMDQARTVRAEFEIERATLTVDRTGAGSVQSDPAGIDCGSDCSFDFPLGTPVDLSAMAAPQNDFTGWGRDCSGTGACSVQMDGDRTVSASFEGQSFDLAVSLGGPGMGRVTSDPAGIDCGADCDETFGVGTMVTLTATVSSGNRFAGWSGDCAGLDVCELTMDQARAVEARFEIESRTVTVTVDGSGRVTSNPAGIDCPGTCSVDFGLGTQVELLAAPGAGQALRAWSGACVDRGACLLDLSSDLSVEASFVDFYLVPLADDMACLGGFGLDAGSRLQNDCGGVAATEIGPWSSVAARTSELNDGYRTGAPGSALDSGVSLAPGPATIELSARRTGNAFDGAGFGILVADRQARGPGVELRLHDDGRLEFASFTGTATTSVQTSTGALAANTWGHVAVSTDGSDVDLLLDGRLVATGTVSWTGSSSTAWVGAGRDGSSPRNGLDGDVDEVRFSDVARY